MEYNASRSILKKSFKNPMFSLVPFEIWRDLIVFNCDPRSLALLSQTCRAFKAIADLGAKFFDLALSFRREGQILLAKKYLKICAKNNSIAMFHLGYGYFNNGWALKQNAPKAVEWLRKSSERGYFVAMTFYAYLLQAGFGVKRDQELSKVWAQKALSSGNSLAIGCCHYYGLTTCDYKKLASFFEGPAEEGNEFAQHYFACCFYHSFGVPKDLNRAHYWYLKSAEQGFIKSQTMISTLEQNVDAGNMWKKKANDQIHVKIEKGKE